MNSKEYKKAQVEAADDIAEMELAKVQQVQTEQPQSQQEREALIAEAYRLTGRIEGVNFISKVATVSNLMMLRQIKESKIYKEMSGIGTWENYCESIGFSKRTVDEQLMNLNTLGTEFLETVSTFGIGYRELKKLRSAASEGTLSITDNSITIEVIEGETTKQETIPLNDKDELKDALERIIAAKDEALAAKERELKAQKDLNEWNKDRLDRTETALSKKSKELSEITATGEINGMPYQDWAVFHSLSGAAREITEIYHSLKETHAKELSDNNTQYLYGTIMYLVQIAGELSLLVPSSIGELNTSEAELAEAAELPIPGIRNIQGHKIKEG